MDMTELTVRSVREVAADIFEYRLVSEDGGDLPPFTPGAHIHVAVPSGGTRQYSLSNDPADRSEYVIAVKREMEGNGGSVSLIERTRAGDRIAVSEPRNDFELKTDAERIILIAGGIGITPILSMARFLHRTGAVPFHMYYLARTPEMAAYRDELLDGELKDQVTIHHDFGDPAKSIDLNGILSDSAGAVIYCCGPTGLLKAVKAATAAWPQGSVRFEDFGTTPVVTGDTEKPFWVSLQETEARYLVPADRTILQVLTEAGLDLPSSCEAGTCGTCRMRLIDGVADHRDLVLFDDEMDDNIIICCSRAKSDEITIARIA